MAEFDVYQKEPGLYMDETESPPPPPSGIGVGIGAMFGVTKWGPMLPQFVTSFAQWTRLYGSYISAQYPSAKQVKKFFKNGGSRLWFKRIVHYSDITDADTKISAAAVGYIYDDAVTPASIDPAVADPGNTGNDTAVSGGSYVGLVDGQFRITVTTPGLYGVAEVSVFFTPEGGSESFIDFYNPLPDTPFVLDNGAILTLSDAGGVALDDGDTWTVDVYAALYRDDDRRIKAMALYDGALGNDLTIDVSEGTLGVAGEFKLEIKLSGELIENAWDNLSLDVDAPNYFKNIVNGSSRYIWLDEMPNVNDLNLSQTATLDGGDDGLTGLADSDYIGDPTAETGLQAIKVVTADPLNIGCPDEDVKETALVRKEISRFVDYDMKTSFGISVAPEGYTPEEVLTFQDTVLTTDSPRSALYYPWIIDEDDNTLISPMGSLMGMFARFAEEKGIWYSPAGTEARLLGTSGLERRIGSTNAGRLNEKRINVLKWLDGIGVVSWGSRTLAIATVADFKYIGVRLNTSDIEARVLRNTLWAVHRPNDENLWVAITRTVNQILNTRYLEGGLDGDTIDQAYQVICDKSINTQKVKNQGLVKCRIGLWNKQTAEFIWFTVTQFASGGTITE
jgi:hypothetical protein